MRQSFSRRLDALKAAYAPLQGEDANSFAPLLSLYEQIVERAEDAPAEAEA